MKIRVLVNPKAGAGAALRKIPEVVGELQRRGIPHDVVQTTRPREAEIMADRALDDGVDCLAVVGGDGTLNEVVQGYLDPEGRPKPGPELGLIPAGTGGDFRKSFGLTGSVQASVARLVEGTPRPIDLGVLELLGGERPLRRAFVNVMSFGLGGLTDRIVNDGPKWMGGRSAFLFGAVRALLVYRNARTQVTVDGAPFYEGPIVNVAVANGRYFGGGMMIAPAADPSDGRFDVVAIGDLNRLRTLMLTGHIYKGTHVRVSGVEVTRGTVVEARAFSTRERVLIDLDGETPGQLPLRASLRPSALRLRV